MTEAGAGAVQGFILISLVCTLVCTPAAVASVVTVAVVRVVVCTIRCKCDKVYCSGNSGGWGGGCM